jgi:enolase
MVKIKEVSAEVINDSRKQEKTIQVKIKTTSGNFSASSPTGKSTGKYEAKPYKKSIESDIENLKKFSEYFSEEILEKFEDIRRIEDITDNQIGANTLFALEAAALKAIAKEQKKQVWQLINPKVKKNHRIRLIGNCIGGGKHNPSGKNTPTRKPDFQEFLLIPNKKTMKDCWEQAKKIKKDLEITLKQKDPKFNSRKNDEDAWITSLNEKEIFEILKQTKIPFGSDIAASSFYKRKKYQYQNPLLKRNEKEQLAYLTNLLKNFSPLYLEDPFEEEDFETFSELLKKFPNILIVGDDLTVTNPKRLEKAIKLKSINAIIVKPNQIGSLLDVKRVCELAKENNIKLIFSHRSGETNEDIISDLAYGFEAEFVKFGITGKERETKIKRIIEIENSLK